MSAPAAEKAGKDLGVSHKLRVPIIRIIVFWGLYWGPLILGNYHFGLAACRGVRFSNVVILKTELLLLLLSSLHQCYVYKVMGFVLRVWDFGLASLG